MNRVISLVKNTFILAVGTIAPKLANFIILPLLTAYLTKKEYGTYDLIVTLCFLLIPIATLQIQTAAFRFLIEAKGDEKKRIITNIFAYIVPTSLISFFIIYFVSYTIPIFARVMIAIYFMAEIIYQTLGQIVRGLSKNKIYSSAAVICSITNMVAIVIFVWRLKWGLNGVLLAITLSVALPTIFIIIRSNILREIDFRYVEKNSIIQMLKYSWPMVPNTISMWVMNASDRLVVTFFLGVEANAVYAVAKKIPNILTLAQSTFTMAWQESASLASSDDDVVEYYSDMFDKVFRLMSAVMILVLIALPILFHLLIRGDYAEAYIQMPIIILSMFFYSICSYLGGIYVAEKRTFNVGATTVVSAAVNLFVNLALISFIGLFAASISTLVSYIILSFYRMFNIKKLVDIRYNYKLIVLTVFALSIFCFMSVISAWQIYVFEIITGIVFSYILNRELVQNLWNICMNKIK